MKDGYFITGNDLTRYVRATLIAGPYDFQNAIKLRTAEGVVITQPDRFVFERPLTPLGEIRKRQREQKAASRKLFADNVIVKLQSGPMILEQLHQATGESHSALHQRIAHWKELSMVKSKKENGIRTYSL